MLKRLVAIARNMYQRIVRFSLLTVLRSVRLCCLEMERHASIVAQALLHWPRLQRPLLISEA